MSRKNKLQRFAEVASFPHVYENFDIGSGMLQVSSGQEISLKGKWHEYHFKDDNPIILELACGKGEYTIGLSQMFPDKNFIGVDIKGARIWRGAKTALDQKLNNVAFLRTKIEYINDFFLPGEIHEIWITFPDPFPKKENRRLSSLPFLKRYRKLFSPSTGGILHLKTDDNDLFEFSVETAERTKWVDILYQDYDIYSKPELYSPELGIKTFYEGQHLEAGKTIKYLKLSILPDD